MAHITLLAFPDCAVSGIAGIIDALAIANSWHALIKPETDTGTPLFHWDIVTLDGRPVQGDNKISIQPHLSIHEVRATDVILVPGFIPPLRFIGKVPEEITGWLRAWHHQKALIGSTCTGSFFLAETGLLDGKVATTNWLFARNFRKLYPRVKLRSERILTEHDGLLCTGATTAFLDLCLHLIKRFGSEELAATCSKSLLMETTRQSQSPFFIFDYYKGHSDTTVFKAQLLMEKQYTEPISIEALASDLGISPRHFIRRFKIATGDTPLAYLQRIRIEAAKQTLETTEKSIDEITWQVGYEDTNSFRKLFRKNTGLSPKEYRSRFTQLPHRA